MYYVILCYHIILHYITLHYIISYSSILSLSLSLSLPLYVCTYIYIYIYTHIPFVRSRQAPGAERDRAADARAAGGLPAAQLWFRGLGV